MEHDADAAMGPTVTGIGAAPARAFRRVASLLLGAAAVWAILAVRPWVAAAFLVASGVAAPPALSFVMLEETHVVVRSGRHRFAIPRGEVAAVTWEPAPLGQRVVVTDTAGTDHAIRLRGLLARVVHAPGWGWAAFREVEVVAKAMGLERDLDTSWPGTARWVRP